MFPTHTNSYYIFIAAIKLYSERERKRFSQIKVVAPIKRGACRENYTLAQWPVCAFNNHKATRGVCVQAIIPALGAKTRERKPNGRPIDYRNL